VYSLLHAESDITARALSYALSADIVNTFICHRASITASATFGHSASPDNGTCWHIMALQGAMQVYVKYFDNFCHHNPLYSHHL